MKTIGSPAFLVLLFGISLTITAVNKIVLIEQTKKVILFHMPLKPTSWYITYEDRCIAKINSKVISQPTFNLSADGEIYAKKSSELKILKFTGTALFNALNQLVAGNVQIGENISLNTSGVSPIVANIKIDLEENKSDQTFRIATPISINQLEDTIQIFSIGASNMRRSIPSLPINIYKDKSSICRDSNKIGLNISTLEKWGYR